MNISFSQYFNAIRFRINGNGYSDETIVRLLNGATPQYDANYDAYKLFSLNTNVPSIYTRTNNNEDLSINSINLLQKDSVVTVYVNIPAAGTYTVDIENIYPFENNYKISFSDLIQNTHYYINSDTSLSFQFTQGDSIAAFSFNVSTPLVVNTQHESCSGAKNGSLSIINAGNNEWEYSLISSNGSEASEVTVQSETVDITDLSPDNYIIISHWRGIIDTVSTTINQGISIVADFQLNTDTLFLNNNVATVTPLNNSTNAVNYLWDFGNGISSNDATPVIEYNAEGNYLISLVASNGSCSDTTTQQITVANNTVTSIADLSNENNEMKLATLSPNNYKIIGNKSINSIEIINMNGQIVLSTNNSTFSLHDLAAGQYLVKVNTNDYQTQMFRIILN